MAAKGCPLVLIEWEDTQPIPAWTHLNAMEAPAAVHCVSVGWLIADGPVKALAPNMGDVHSGSNVMAQYWRQFSVSAAVARAVESNL